MKPKYFLFVLPLLFLNIFSCKKSDSEPVKTIKPPGIRADTYDPLHPINVRVTLSNTSSQPVFAVIQIIPGGQYSAAPLDEKIININDVELDPINEVFFSVLPGTYYTVRVISTYGEHYYGLDIMAGYDLVTTSFNGQIVAPGITQYVPDPPLPPIPPNDDRNLYPPVPNVTYPFTVNAYSMIEGGLPYEVQLVADFTGFALQTRSLRYYANGSYHFTPEAVFNLPPGFNFYFKVVSETGGVLFSGVQTSLDAPQHISL